MKKLNTAFTFIELLIALTIFSLIAASVYFTMNAGIGMYSRGNSIIMDNQKLRIFFDAISLDLRNAVPDLGKEESLFIKSEWKEEHISFLTIVNFFEENGVNTELAKVSYYLDKKAGKEFLMRKCATVKEGFDLERAEEDALVGDLENFDLEDFRFKYAYKIAGFENEYDWREEAQIEGGIPRGIKIGLTLKDRKLGAKEKFEKTVFVARGKLGGEGK